jgi:hypothetical protein
MSTIKSFDKTTCRLVAQEAQAALAEIAKKHNLAFSYRGGNFTNNTFLLKGEFAIIANGQVQSREAEEFVRYAQLYGLKAEDLGREFESNGKRFTVSGLKPNSRAYPLLGKEIGTDRVFKFKAAPIVAKLHPKGAGQTLTESDDLLK